MSQEHYFSATPAVELTKHVHTLNIRGTEHQVTTASGVFSGGRVDLGTQVLLSHVPDPQAGLALDVGCGWGPITMALCDALKGTDSEVLAVDVNTRALELSGQNAKAAGYSVATFTPEQLEKYLLGNNLKLRTIWSNPPVRIGKQALHELLLKWLAFLADDGAAWLVVQRNLGADSLAKWLSAQGWQVEKAASSKGFMFFKVTH